MECIYCHEESEFRRSIMEELCTLPYSTVYVFRSQTYYGRCVVAFRLRHVNELFELTAEERHGYMDDVARTASAIQRAVGAEKINYAIYGDLMPHVHFHLVPKRPGAPDWGGNGAAGGGDARAARRSAPRVQSMTLCRRRAAHKILCSLLFTQ